MERAAHWANALLFGILMATALPLYFVQVETIVGRRALIAEIHTWCRGRPAGPPDHLAGRPVGGQAPAGRAALQPLDPVGAPVVVVAGPGRLPKPDKFNPGQKLNALFIGGAIVVMLGTGSILKWYRLFPLDWRTGATFVHDVLAFAVFIVVFGHIVFALPTATPSGSMFRGWVTESWARRHAAGWLNRIFRVAGHFIRIFSEDPVAPVP